MLRIRILTAVIGVPLLLAMFIAGPEWLVFCFLLICLTLSVFEASRMVVPTLERVIGGVSADGNHSGTTRFDRDRLLYLTVALGWIIFLASSVGPHGEARGIIVFGLISTIVVSTFLAKDVELAMAQMLGVLFGLCYGALPWIAVWDLFLMGEGGRYLLLTLVIVWLGDTGGYFGGRALGGKIFGRKMSPARSPNKTWEGSLSGIVLSVAGALTINLVYGNTLAPWFVLVVVAITGGVTGQLGDLVESTLKRFAKVKDSGTIIPGHGGFLDRVDGILYAAPACWSVLYLLG